MVAAVVVDTMIASAWLGLRASERKASVPPGATFPRPGSSSGFGSRLLGSRAPPPGVRTRVTAAVDERPGPLGQ